MKTWTIKRTVIEMYEVTAETKEEAHRKVQNPYSITVIKETMKLTKLK